MGQPENEEKDQRRRLNRYFHIAGEWYVEVREGRKGPFMRREDAVAFLEKHLRTNGHNRV